MLDTELLYSCRERHLQHRHVRVGGSGEVVASLVEGEVAVGWLIRVVADERIES